MIFKQIFKLLFFEQGYFGNPWGFGPDIFCVTFKFLLQGIMSQNLDLALSFDFITQNAITCYIFIEYLFLHDIK